MATSLAVQHILSHLPQAPRSQPLFVAVQGPQGSGKTHLTRSLVSILSEPPHSLRLAVLSVDDLYLTHDELVRLATENSENPLWRGRGQPGTHDLTLGADILKRLRDLNATRSGATSTSQVVLPGFDKSKFNGEGDRAEKGIVVNAPIDVVVLEGWCMGFYPLTREELDTKWESVRIQAKTSSESIVQRSMMGIRKEHLQTVNEALRGYVKQWYEYFDVFVQIQPPAHAPYEYIYTWRLQQEHYMKAINGGIGMSDEQIQSFVDRYIPGYVFFGLGVTKGGTAEGEPRWKNKGIRITIDQKRQVVGTENF
ncbi:P-loop containing nucleoside triphosphate hydrolase protein [Ramaria rubella]|nr:P-loop containing nucleoside triphosphate hydrolase protein [Ramaria rubella]